jgi:hypothetical protein
MALVGVIAKELTDDDLEGASRGKIPGDLGGGKFGAKNVPRGFPDPEGGHAGGRGTTPPSARYHERMRGGADVPAHALAREEEGRSVIPHPASHQSLLEAEADGPEAEADFHERKDRLMGNAMRGGRGLAGAMRRQGVNPLEFYEGTPTNIPGGIAPGVKHGVKTAQIPGRVESAPHEHRHAELGEGSEIDDILDGLAESHDRRKVTEQNTQQLSAGANTPNTEGRKQRDAPEGTGSRRQED